MTSQATERPTSIKLLSIENIAEMHQCSVRMARDVIVKKQGFPNAIPTSTPRKRFWLERDIYNYLSGWQKKRKSA